MDPQDDRRKELSRHVAHVPLVEVDNEESLLTYKEALVVWRDLRHNDSQIPDRTELLVKKLEGELIPQLDRIDRFRDDTIHYVITPIELHGIIARAAIRGSAQTVVDIGSRMENAVELNRLLDDSTEQGDQPETT